MATHYNSDGSASYTWDTLKKGMLTSETQNGITRNYTYTNALQLASSSVKVASSVGGDNVTRIISHQYDGFYGRPKGLTYPNGLTLEYRYNDAGYLAQTRNAASQYVYRDITQMDAAGHITGSQMANALLEQTSDYNSEGTMASTEVSSSLGLLHSHYYDQYDSFMNLIEERNGATGLAKSYEYDELNRLEKYTYSNAGFAIYDNTTPFAATVNYGYDTVGNLLKKTDYSRNTANAYEYNSSCASGSNAGPNAVCAITKLNGSRVQFSYDSRGNLISGDGLTMTYNALDKPLTVVGRGPNNNTSTGFVYGSDNMRALQTRTVSGTTTKTHYVDKLFEADNDGSWRAYIGDIAVLSYTPERSHQLLYTLRDRLGSATTMVDHQGNIISQRYFDPFGRTATASVAGSLGDLIETNGNRRGFTDHEHLNEQQLIHMNGRVYDYNMGRFMSVDPFIQSPTSTQSVNPYSYIMNNPLAGTDPTGYVAEGPELEKVEYTKETEKVAVTGSRIKRSVTTGVSGTATYSNGATQSFSVNFSEGKATSVSIGSLQEVAAKREDGVKDAAGSVSQATTGASVITAGLEQTNDLALLNKSGAGTALMATGATGNAWKLSKDAKSTMKVLSLDGSKLASKMSPYLTGVGLAASVTSNVLNEGATTKEAAFKSSGDVSMALIGLRGGGAGAAASIAYSVIDLTYPGGFIQLTRDTNRGVSNFSKSIDKNNVEQGFREDPINTMKRTFGIPVIEL
ncbi:hypothetical protein A9267_21110 [Shewanella sp. UCD-FRSSP16_17]|uniref:RHS repeat domain-containing protein n=1 Tax=Shewanella sp. UCD-FRSSP16_17 TaxID=1853256 RepID=UPI0007EE9801|nr:RHS repeat-associated core domain-containing protein [Shewanella sp. UCD-FRSSP16_17]OBT09337.1 hypothetical protein A9267_21110 [Shewanella sp. UCD-FRSSP16_17]